MNCVICKQGETRDGKVTVTLERGETTVLIKDVPAQVCENCGEYYLAEQISAELLQTAENAVRKGAEVEIIRYVA
ncbi:MAG: type II toxin-antitoxin system MqsA family antitoxin [Candidatus Glassbacteria bacterium]|nr:type II toxin-antitoxin system MqsA family antitoxin [Candidatus Glassbacteria bacterium]